MSRQPKWQRARVLDRRADGWEYLLSWQQPGMLVWAKATPPVRGIGVYPGGLEVFHEGVLEVFAPVAHENGYPFAVPRDGVELLAEFSFSDDPDAEVRQ